MQTVNFNAIEKLDFRTKESYKTLRTNLEFSGRDRKVISVTSCTPNEGKTSVSFQLALSVAEGGKRVVLVDADLRKSVLKGRYKTNASRYGLSHYLSGQASIADVTCKTNIENFYVIFSGPVPPNPSELLGNDAFRLLLEYLRNEYDYVIVDTPPLGSVIDGAVAAQYCDGTVVVIESGAISYKFAQKVKEQLEKVDCRILGVILNKVNMSGKGYYGAYYGKYYGKYYGGNEEGGLHSAVVQKGLKPAKTGTKQEESGAASKVHEGKAAAKADGNVKLMAGEVEKEAESLYEEDDMIQLDVDMVQLEVEELEEDTEVTEAGK